MKRSGFASQWKPRPPAEERPERPILRLVRVPKPSAPVFAPQPKHEYLRDRSYRQFVAGHDCFACGIGGRSQAAHSNNSTRDGKGGSIKASDSALFPLCATEPGRVGCHEKHDLAKDGMTREERRAREVEWIDRMHELARAAGRKEIE